METDELLICRHFRIPPQIPSTSSSKLSPHLGAHQLARVTVQYFSGMTVTPLCLVSACTHTNLIYFTNALVSRKLSQPIVRSGMLKPFLNLKPIMIQEVEVS